MFVRLCLRGSCTHYTVAHRDFRGGAPSRNSYSREASNGINSNLHHCEDIYSESVEAGDELE